MSQTETVIDTARQLSELLDIPLTDALKLVVSMHQNVILENLNKTLKSGFAEIMSTHTSILFN